MVDFKRVVLVGVWLLCIGVGSAESAPYLLVTGGGGGAADAASIGLEFGGSTAIRNFTPLALEITSSFTDDAPSDILDYEVPHSGYNILGEKNKGSEYGFLIKSGFNLKNLSILVGAGASFQEKVLVARSTATGWYYTQSSNTDVNGQFYGGLLYRFGKLAVSAGLDNRRGIVAGLGYAW